MISFAYVWSNYWDVNKHENLRLELHLVTPATMLLKEKKLQYEVFDD